MVTRGPANTMWRKLLYSGFETYFGPSTQGAGTQGAGTQGAETQGAGTQGAGTQGTGTKTHLKFRFLRHLIKKEEAVLECEVDGP